MKPYSTDLKNTPPLKDEFEITLFGPGVGECIVVHLGDNNWMIVDSCLNPVTRKPIAIEYLEHIGVNPRTAIKILIISHWHADHIKGVSEIAKICPDTIICYSLALLKKEFLTLVDLFSGKNALTDRKTSATREMANLIDVLQNRCSTDSDYKSAYLTPTRADQLLYRKQMKNVRVSVQALSPSNKSIHNALQEFASLILEKGGFRRITPSPTQNHNALALQIQFGKNKILLGADLEESADPLTGWRAIVNSPLRPDGKSIVFKIPHHGSETAHSHDVWQKMVCSSAIAMLTTKLGGRSSLPKKNDIKRIKGYTPYVFCTRTPKHTRIKRDRAVEKTIKSVVKKRKIIGLAIGQIQTRIASNSEITVGLKPPAASI